MACLCVRDYVRLRQSNAFTKRIMDGNPISYDMRGTPLQVAYAHPLMRDHYVADTRMILRQHLPSRNIWHGVRMSAASGILSRARRHVGPREWAPLPPAVAPFNSQEVAGMRMAFGPPMRDVFPFPNMPPRDGDESSAGVTGDISDSESIISVSSSI